jgi:hypothetical protein
MAVSGEVAALIGVGGTVVGAFSKWALDMLDYRVKRGDRIRERTYPDRVTSYMNFVWAVDAVVTAPRSQRKEIHDQLGRHRAGDEAMPETVRGALTARDRIMLIASPGVRAAARDFFDLIEQPESDEVAEVRENFRKAATAEFEMG